MEILRKHVKQLFFLCLTLIMGCKLIVLENSDNIKTDKTCSNREIENVDEILIGATAPFSPPGAANEGLAMMVAFQIAERDVNQAGGVLNKQIRILIDDTAGLPARGREIAERLIKESCVVGIVGEYHSDVGLAIMEVTHKYHVPTIFAETYSDEITSSRYSEIFRISPTSSITAQLDAKWFASIGDYNGDGNLFAVFIAEDTNYGKNQISRAETWFPEYALNIKSFIVDFSSENFQDILENIQALPEIPDVIFIKVTGDASLILLREIINLGLAPNNNTLVVANQVALNHEIYWEMVPNGTFVIVPRVGPWPTIATEKGMEFAQKYYNILEKWPEAYAFEAYDSVLLMADAINRAGVLDSDEIIKALENTNIELASGTYHFPFGSESPPGGFVPDFMWHQWPDMPLLFLQYTELNQHSENMSVIWPPAYSTIDSIVQPENQD